MRHGLEEDSASKRLQTPEREKKRNTLQKDSSGVGVIVVV